MLCLNDNARVMIGTEKRYPGLAGSRSVTGESHTIELGFGAQTSVRWERRSSRDELRGASRHSLE